MNGFLATFGAYERFVHKLHFCTCPELQFWLPSIIDVQQIVHKLQSCTAFKHARSPGAYGSQSSAASNRMRPSAFRSAFGGKALAARSASTMSEMNVRWMTGSKRGAMRASEHDRTGSAWRRIDCLQLVEHWLHVLEGAELGESDILQALAHHGNVRAEVLGLVRVTANREDAPAQVAVQAQ